MTAEPIVAILTGDLIGSTQVEPAVVDQALSVMANAAQEIGQWSGADPRFTRFRGDGWQIVIAEPDLALRAAIFLAARLRASKTQIATRIAIGIGPIDSIGTRDLSDAGGAAFVASGRTLDGMLKIKTLDVAGRGVTLLHSGFVNLVEATIRRWTPEQAEAIGYYLHPDNPTLEDIASHLGITIQAVSYRIRGGNGSDIRQALKSWESDFDWTTYPESRKP